MMPRYFVIFLVSGPVLRAHGAGIVLTLAHEATRRNGGAGSLGSAGIAYRVLDGPGAGEREEELLALTDEVYGKDRDPEAVRRAKVWRKQPGFALVEARHGGYLVGYASGMPLRASTSWWRGLTTPLPDDVTEERPGRTFALTDLVVRASWRRQGIGRELAEALLAERTEERAALTVSQGASAAQAAFRSWGWRKIARTRGDVSGGPVLDVLVIDLPWVPPSRDWWS
jgi:ribosomal protein S18 acetylase RimI-like enzyme